jgi:RNA polymerase subunit RPABC4/transcription elongation factor Spt4
MTYRGPTGPEMLIIAIAFIVPLVYAFTHHGRARKLTLMVWLPAGLLVARAVYYVPAAGLRPTPLVLAIYTLMDPLTLFWPAGVLIFYGVGRFFRRSRRREKQSDPALDGADRAQRVVNNATAGRPASAAPTKRCLGCGRTLPAQTRQCPQCHYTFTALPTLPTGARVAAPPQGAPRGAWCPQCGASTVADMNFCAQCGRALTRPARRGTRPETV